MTTDFPKRWAVTGATGLLGNNLVRTLLSRGAEVRVLVRGEDRRELRGLSCHQEPGDLGDLPALMRCFEGAEVVCHVAAMVHVGHSRRDEMVEINVEGTRRVCEAMPEGARLLHISSVDALGFGSLASPSTEEDGPRSEEGGIPYPDTKRQADEVVRASGVDHVILHPTFMLGPYDWKPSSGAMLLEVAKGLGRIAPPGANNFVHVQDVVEGILAAASAPRGRAYILGNQDLSYRDAWAQMAKVVGRAPPVATFPKAIGPLASFLFDIPRRLGFKEGDINGATTHFGFIEHCFDASRAREELSLPQTPIEDAIQGAWAFFQAEGYLN